MEQRILKVDEETTIACWCSKTHQNDNESEKSGHIQDEKKNKKKEIKKNKKKKKTVSKQERKSTRRRMKERGRYTRF